MLSGFGYPRWVPLRYVNDTLATTSKCRSSVLKILKDKILEGKRDFL